MADVRDAAFLLVIIATQTLHMKQLDADDAAAAEIFTVVSSKLTCIGIV